MWYPLVLCSLVGVERNRAFVLQPGKEQLAPRSSYRSSSNNELEEDYQEPQQNHGHLWDDACENYPSLIVLHQDENLLIINKPSDIPHHNDEERDGEAVPGLLTLTRYQMRSGKLLLLDSNDSTILTPLSPPNPLPRLYGVHRLDRVTSGIILMAKNVETAKLLTRGFREQKITKFYTGLSWNKPKKKKQGLVQGLLTRGRRKSWYLTPLTGKKETDSSSSSSSFCQTRFYTAGLGHLTLSNDLALQPLPKTLLLFRPFTGRTHQLRVTAKSVGLALAGDKIYASAPESGKDVVRTCLHATALHVPQSLLPDTKNGVTIWSTPDFASWYNLSLDGQSSFNESLLKLVQKHCDDSPEIQRVAIDNLERCIYTE